MLSVKAAKISKFVRLKRCQSFEGAFTTKMLALKLASIISAIGLGLLFVPQTVLATCANASPFHDVPGYPSCVFFADQLLKWPEARSVCLALGGDLPSFHSEAQHSALAEAWRNRPDNRFPNFPMFWTGLHREAGGDLKWSDGTGFLYRGADVFNEKEQYFSAGPGLTLFGFKNGDVMVMPFICAKKVE